MDSEDDSDGSEGLPDLIDDDDGDKAPSSTVLSSSSEPSPLSVDRPFPETNTSQANSLDFLYDDDEEVSFNRSSPSLPRTDAFYTPPSGYARFSMALGVIGSSTYDISLLRDFKRIPRKEIGNNAGVLVAEGEGILGPFGRAYYTPDAKINFFTYSWEPIAGFDVEYNAKLDSYVMPITRDFTAVFELSRIDNKLYLCDIPLSIFSLDPGDNILCTSHDGNSRGKKTVGDDEVFYN